MAEPYFYTTRIRNAPIRRRLDRRFLSWVMIAACTGTFVACAFVYSARCHFEAVSLGYETQERRGELAKLAERKRQLELERARSLSPDELEHRARRIGLRDAELPSAVAEAAAKSNATKPRAQAVPAQAAVARTVAP